MGDAIDRISTLLASGASRRELAGAALAAGAALLPWTAAAGNRKKRRQRRRIIRQSLDYCQSWCDKKFEGDEAAIQSCLNAAKEGKGPCYSAAEKGPGHFCLREKPCGLGSFCCPEVSGGGPVTEGACCPKGTLCAFLNGTTPEQLCVVF